MTTADYLESLQNDMQTLKTNVEAKGVEVSDSDNFTTLANKVADIKSGSSRDWTKIGYEKEPNYIDEDFEYSVEIKNNWQPNTSLRSKFINDTNLVYMPLVDTSIATDNESMFKNCYSLKEVPELNTTNSTAFVSMFENCYSLRKLAELNTSSVIYMALAFSNCYALKYFGGLKNIGKAYLTTASANYSNYAFVLTSSPLLTYDGLMNVINNLYDIATAGVQTQELRLGTTNLAKLTAEEIAIATNKGWTVS